MARKVPRSSEALGTLVPPTWVVCAGLRIRASLGVLHSRMVPGFNLVLEHVLGLVDTKALYCAVDLRLPDLLAGGPQTAVQLAVASGSDPDAVERLMRFLVMRGFFKHRGGRYVNNAASDRLRADHPYSFREWVVFFGSEWNLRIWNEMPGRVRDGRALTDSWHCTGFDLPACRATCNHHAAVGTLRYRSAPTRREVDSRYPEPSR